MMSNMRWLTISDLKWSKVKLFLAVLTVVIGLGSISNSEGYAAEVEYYLLDNGTLVIHGTENRDYLFVYVEDVGRSSLTTFDLRISTWAPVTGYRHTRFPLEKINEIVCHMGEGNDEWNEARLPPGIPGDLYHLIDVNPDLSIAVFGGKGEDLIVSRNDRAYVSGGDDDDTLLLRGKGSEAFGGYGNDYVNSDGRKTTIWGGPGDDVLHPFGAENVAYGEDGQDVFNYVHPSSKIITGQGYDVWRVFSLESVADAGPDEGYPGDYWTEYPYRDSMVSGSSSTWNAFNIIKYWDNAGYTFYSDPDFFE